MIAHITGQIVKKEPTHVVLDVGGIGYAIRISLHTFSAIQTKETCRLFTYLHIKEDAHTLYGFLHQEEKQWFSHLISVNGIGPTTAISILSSLSTEELYHAISNGNVHVLQSTKGIGAKAAQRIILVLGGKVTSSATSPNNSVYQEALAALITLGMSKQTAEKAITRILKQHSPETPLEDVIKLALRG